MARSLPRASAPAPRRAGRVRVRPDLDAGSLRLEAPVPWTRSRLRRQLAGAPEGLGLVVGSGPARIRTAASATLNANAARSKAGANWPAIADGDTSRPLLVQYCHGAPGMVSACADARIARPDLVSLLEAGGRFTWQAGPLAK